MTGLVGFWGIALAIAKRQPTPVFGWGVGLTIAAALIQVASGLVLYAAPQAAARLAEARGMLENAEGLVGVSAGNDLLVARAAAPDGRTLQGDLTRLIEGLHGRPLPRIWKC